MYEFLSTQMWKAYLRGVVGYFEVASWSDRAEDYRTECWA